MRSARAMHYCASMRDRFVRYPARALITSTLAGLLASCAAGPDFKRPDGPVVPSYTATALPAQTTAAAVALGGSQSFLVGADVGSQWWQELGSAKLNAWVEQALLTSPTLASAQATLMQAQETFSAQAGSTRFPKVDASAATQRQRLNPNMLGQPGDPREFSLYNAGVAGHYRLDLAGGNRRALEALAARTDHRRYELVGVRLTLAANVSTTAIAQAALAGQIAATEAMVRAQEEEVELARERVRLGHASPDDVLTLETHAEQTRAELPVLQQRLEQGKHLLAVLAGQAPGASMVPEFTLSDFKLPTELPVLLPSELVRRRPDIQAAEALLHAANAEYGVAVAALYPQVDLSANLGSQTLSSGTLFGSGSAVWNVLGQLTQPLFDRGLPARKRASLAALDAAAAHYQSVVLDALRNVADTLRALEHDAQRLNSLAAADTAAIASLDSIERQYALGAASYVQLLIARQQMQQGRLDLIAAQAQRLADSAALFQAMGGGYSSAASGER